LRDFFDIALSRLETDLRAEIDKNKVSLQKSPEQKNEFLDAITKLIDKKLEGVVSSGDEQQMHANNEQRPAGSKGSQVRQDKAGSRPGS